MRAAVAGSPSLTAALRQLGLRPAGGNHGTLRKLIERYGIPTDHFNQNWVLRGPRSQRAIPLSDALVENSTYNRTNSRSGYTKPGSSSDDVNRAARARNGTAGTCR